jgi:hypothetical protein
MLQLSELNWVTESVILGRLYLSAQIKFLAKIHHDLPRKFEYEKHR